MPSNHPDKSHPTPAKKDDHPTTTTTSAATTTNRNNNQQPSLLSRIQNSASSLIQESLTKPSGATLSGDLAHVLDSGNKASSSSSSASFSGQTWRTNGLEGGNASSTGGYIYDGYATGLSEGFRSSQPNSVDASEFDSFQNTGGFFNFADDTYTKDEKEEEEEEGKVKGKSREQPIYNDNNFSQSQEGIDIDIGTNDEYESSHFNAYEIAWINASRSGTVYRSTTSTPNKRLSQNSQSDINTFTQQLQQPQSENDGAEVVTLLSDPSFQPGLVTWDNNNQHYDGTSNGFGFDLDLDDDPLDSEGFPHALAQGLSPAEIQILDLFRKQQQPPQHQQEQQQQQKKITGLSLVPDIDSFLSQHDASKADDDALRNEVIANLIGAEEWVHVDERYGDEVWGYLRPAVEAAAAEIKEKEASEGGGGGDGPAVKRLKMILRHMARL